jgi:uncharacterized surface anchored protein
MKKMKRIIFTFSALVLITLCNSCSKTEYDLFATLYGVVSDSGTGEPIGGASVLLSPSGETKITGTDGRFEFNDLDPAQYTIMAKKTGYQTNLKPVTAVVGKSAEANIPLTKSN